MSRFLQKRAHSTRNNDAFTYCGIYLISPNTLQFSGERPTFVCACVGVGVRARTLPNWSRNRDWRSPKMKVFKQCWWSPGAETARVSPAFLHGILYHRVTKNPLCSPPMRVCLRPRGTHLKQWCSCARISPPHQQAGEHLLSWFNIVAMRDKTPLRCVPAHYIIIITVIGYRHMPAVFARCLINILTVHQHTYFACTMSD